jgi:hypothetical protein
VVRLRCDRSGFTGFDSIIERSGIIDTNPDSNPDFGDYKALTQYIHEAGGLRGRALTSWAITRCTTGWITRPHSRTIIHPVANHMGADVYSVSLAAETVEYTVQQNSFAAHPPLQFPPSSHHRPIFSRCFTCFVVN